MYWRIGPRYRGRPRADNKHDLRQLAGSGQLPGLLACDGGIAVGWCELALRASLDGWPAAGAPALLYQVSAHRPGYLMSARASMESRLPAKANIRATYCPDRSV